MLAKGLSSKTLRFLLVVTLGLFSFSEGKPCPEKTRAHKTRCDSYFKCMMLPSKSHVWIPEKCEQGLIYEPNLRICVLPGDDWECNLGDASKDSYSDDDNVVYGVEVDGLNGLNSLTQPTDDHQVELETTSLSDNEDIMMEEESKSSDYISIGSGDHLADHDFESSGDGVGTDFIMVDTLPVESKTSIEELGVPQSPAQTKIDPKLTAHLQRLSQLIDGLKQTYQSKETSTSDLRPDQLNAFLAHYNIKSQLDSLNPVELKENSTTTTSTPQNHTEAMKSTTPASTNLDPETKVVLTHQIPALYSSKLHPTDGYSNSQIVVNKPEGSVLFTLGNQPQDQITDHRYDPKISEETLKTVLELSKQMIENQNVRQVLPNSAFYPHVVQPIYLPPPIPQYAQNVFNQHDGYDDKKYDKVSSTYYVPQDKNEKPPTTIIHNNVITSIPDKKDEQVDSYGQKINSYPPLTDYQYSSGEVSSENQNHKLANRYENNQLVTIRPSPSYNNYQFQNDYRPTTTTRPYISDSGSTLTDYYTPSPHLDESNVNNVFQVERYPTVNYGNALPRPGPPQSNYAQIQNHNQHENQNLNQQQAQTYYQNRPNPSQYIPPPQQPGQDNPYQSYYNPYQSYYYPTQSPQSLNKLFPSLDASKVKIRPNSQKLESMEQETAEESSDSQSEEDQDPPSSNDDNQSQTYNSYVNKQIVANQLAQYMEHLNGNRPQSYGSSANPIRNRLPAVSQLSPVSQLLPAAVSPLPQQSEDESLLNLNGNLFSYDVYKTKIEEPKVDPSNCLPGVRQPNSTDCTRYFMCSRTDNSVMQYSCPQFTAFNPQTRICDAHYYALCHPGALISRYTVSENRRIQLEAIKALQNAQRIRDQTLQAQKLALRLSLGESESDANKQQQFATSTMPPAQYPSDVLANILQSAIDTNGGSINTQSTSVTPRPHGVPYGTSMATKKRKYYCKEGDKVADQTSIYNYFVCYKNAQGMMKGHKMTCMQGLLFCPMTLVCTLPTRCK